MVRSLKIMLWNEEVGRLHWDRRSRRSYFVYNDKFTKKGVDISPLAAPVNGNRGLLPIWGEDKKIYQKLPSFVADSLPDAWGNQLFDLWCKQQKIPNSDITPLDKLSFIGRRGMGALEFIPEATIEYRKGSIDIKSLVDLAERIYIDRENAHILPEESITMQSLLTVGTSAGGRQPKAVIAINKETGEIRSGQVAGLEGYDYYILKIGNSEYCSAELEFTYYKLATLAGINMMSSELYSVEGNNHFLTKRFDRDGEKKLHTQTLAAMWPDAESYEDLMTVCRRLHLNESDCQEVFRRMIFNILSNNTDDHNKNFSFIMKEDGSWSLSPAYDVTYILDNGGYLPNRDHCLYICAKLHGFTYSDAMCFAHDNGIRRPDIIIREVASSLRQFRTIATENGVSQMWIGRVETTIAKHLNEWGLMENNLPKISAEINGHRVENIHVEQGYKGNYHLMCNIDGMERKFIISKNKEEYSFIERKGVANLTSEELTGMSVKYFGL